MTILTDHNTSYSILNTILPHKTMNITYQTLLSKLRKQTPFAFMRWGDGEIRAVMGDNQPNCDGHDRKGALVDGLCSVLVDQHEKQTLYMGYQSTRHSSAYRPFITNTYSGIKWSNADILHQASTDGVFEDFLLVFSELFDEGVSTMLLSGNEKLYNTIEISTFIQLKPQNSFFKHSLTELENHIIKHDPDVVLFAASMASNVWIAELWKKYPNKIFIDVGSVLDPYAGVVSRAYHWKIVERLGLAHKDLTITGSQTNNDARDK